VTPAQRAQRYCDRLGLTSGNAMHLTAQAAYLAGYWSAVREARKAVAEDLERTQELFPRVALP
jgi:hypothetical protein